MDTLRKVGQFKVFTDSQDQFFLIDKYIKTSVIKDIREKLPDQVREDPSYRIAEADHYKASDFMITQKSDGRSFILQNITNGFKFTVTKADD